MEVNKYRVDRPSYFPSCPRYQFFHSSPWLQDHAHHSCFKIEVAWDARAVHVLCQRKTSGEDMETWWPATPKTLTWNLNSTFHPASEIVTTCFSAVKSWFVIRSRNVVFEVSHLTSHFVPDRYCTELYDWLEGSSILLNRYGWPLSLSRSWWIWFELRSSIHG